MRRALEYADMFGRPIIDHCEDPSLSEGGVMHEGRVSTALGMPSIPSIAEETIVARDLLIAEYTGGPLHLAHISTAGSVRLIREAKSRGVRVTAETCPHYLVLTDEAVRGFDTFMKMNPPLRSAEDQKILIQGLKDGTIDAIATDHAPHAIEDKECEFQAASFGIVGLETAFGLMWTHLVEKKQLTLGELIQKMSVHPRKILGLTENKIEKGALANLTVIDPDMRWTVDSARFESKAKNMPFQGWELKGKPFGVVNRGKMAFIN
jgi:dihydroorotase